MRNSVELAILQRRARARRLLILGIFCVLFFVAVIIQLIRLQIMQADTLRSKSEHNLCFVETIQPKRGRLLDFLDRELATNEEQYELVWHGRGAAVVPPRELGAIETIERLLNIQVDRALLTVASRRHRRVSIAEKISFENICSISECLRSFDCFDVVPSTRRTYPHGALASHILGYLGRDDFMTPPKGRAGLEAILQESLCGTGGAIEHKVNARGDRLSLLRVLHPIDGRDVKLTIDLDSQRFIETLFPNGEAGAFIVMDPEDGSIRASASFPAFDPNRFLAPISTTEWNENFIEGSPLLNRVFAASYPPASIFKLVTCAAALEAGLITLDTEFNCPGYFEFRGRKYNCLRSWGHGRLTARKALAYSCNTFCYTIGSKIHIDQLAYYANQFGLGSSTGSLIPDKSGIVPSSAWKMSVIGQPWWPGETLSASIGQSYILVTPIQLACLVGSIFTGQLVRPRILDEEPVIKTPLAISRSTQHFLRNAMYEVAEEGTARLLSEVSGVEIYAKTGTAQVSGVRRGERLHQQLEHAWCSAYFRVRGQKPLVAIVLVEHAGTSRPAILALEHYLRYLVKNGQSRATEALA